jgi:hypothetical protein
MADFTHTFTYEAGVLRIIDNTTGAPVVDQPHDPNTGLGWTSEEAAIAYGQREFHYMYQQEIPSSSPPAEDTTTPAEPRVTDTTSTSTTVGTGE